MIKNEKKLIKRDFSNIVCYDLDVFLGIQVMFFLCPVADSGSCHNCNCNGDGRSKISPFCT